MAQLLEGIREVLASRRLLRLNLGLWAIVTFGSIFYLAPGPDDNFYVIEGLGLVYFHNIGKLAFDDFFLSFTGFPGYAVVNAVFWKIWLAVGLPLNVYTYKILHVIVAFLLVCLTAKFVDRLVKPADRFRYLPTNVLLVFLGITPFAMDILYPRPEAAGLLALVVGLLAYQKAWRSDLAPAGLVAVSGLCLGVAATHHPGLGIVGLVMGTVVLADLLRRGRWLACTVCIIAAAVPVLLMVFWFLAYAPESLEILMSHAEGREPKLGYAIVVMMKHAMYQSIGSGAQKIYYAIFYFSLLLVLVSVILLAIFKIIYQFNELSKPVNVAVIGLFAGGLVYLLQSGSGRAQLFTVVAYVTVCFLALLLSISSRNVDAHERVDAE